jgi:RNA recognition motif-containing protein
LYVGNLSYDVDSSALEQMFAAYGTVQSAQIISDRDTGRSKGFGFVEMGTDQEAQAAIAGLGGKQVGGRSLTVNEARPKTEGGRVVVEEGAVAVTAAVAAVNDAPTYHPTQALRGPVLFLQESHDFMTPKANPVPLAELRGALAHCPATLAERLRASKRWANGSAPTSSYVPGRAAHGCLRRQRNAA